jgi:hypothetical protein
MVLFPIRAFWRDEWCIIYNLKFKTPEMLWGPLDFTQQFPRIYLQLLKSFTAHLHYTYFSLRLPSFIIGVAAMIFSYRLMNRIFTRKDAGRYLFVLMIAANPVFIYYYVQIKQYEMEILLSLIAIWQFLELQNIRAVRKSVDFRYWVVCLSFLITPFFSYTYPIAIAPAFAIFVVYDLLYFKRIENPQKQSLLYLWLPLIIGCISIAAFYIIDVSQLMTDKNMYGWWEGALMTPGTPFTVIIQRFWLLFSGVGAGVLFQIVFGILGLVSFTYTAYHTAKHLRISFGNKDIWLRLYCILLLTLIIALYFAGKMPIGEAKFNAFAVPFIAILIVFLLDTVRKAPKFTKSISWVNIVLILALAGNIYTDCINIFIEDEFKKKRAIYLATEKAIIYARQNKMPIYITPAVGYPDDITLFMKYLSMPTASGILKTFPAYNINDTVAIYTIKNLNDVNSYHASLSPHDSTVLVGDGFTYKVVKW